jgi:hypothetical protein
LRKSACLESISLKIENWQQFNVKPFKPCHGHMRSEKVPGQHDDSSIVLILTNSFCSVNRVMSK